MRSLCLIFLALIPWESAQAHWQYTTWGMSPKQVALASSGNAPESAGDAGMRKDGLVVGNVGQFIAGQHHFKSVFYYSNSGLFEVNLQLTGAGECANLKDELTDIYGKPSDKYETNFIFQTYTWKDNLKNNSIYMLKFGMDCTISYRPLRVSGL